MIVQKVAGHMPTTVSLAHILLVEGNTPAHFFEAFAKHLSIEKEIEIWNYGGVSQLAKFVKNLSKSPDFKEKVKAVGIVRDAETDPQAAKNSIEYAMQAANFQPQVVKSFLILPDSSTPGMIETLCLRTLEGKPIKLHVDEFFTKAIETGARIPEGIVRDKHFAQAYMATLENLEQFVGMAAYRKAWDFEHDELKIVREFLDKLVAV